MLGQRVLTAVIGIPILLAALYFGGAVWRVLVAVIIIIGLGEFASMSGPGLYFDYLMVSGLSLLAITYSGVDGTAAPLVSPPAHLLLAQGFVQWNARFCIVLQYHGSTLCCPALQLPDLSQGAARHGLDPVWLCHYLGDRYRGVFRGTKYGQRKLCRRSVPINLWNALLAS